MTIVRHYLMTAAEGRGPELRKILQDLANKVRPLAGCEGVELYQDPELEIRFIFQERWTSADAHREAGKALGREVFAPVMAALAKPPEGSYFEPVPTEE
jgi:quinol monooxygenase YgiN